MSFLETLQNSAFAAWVAGAPTILAYPTILALHTVGLGVVVGTNAIVDLRLLGVGKDVPIAELKRVFPPMWMGFALNLATGVALFIAAAEQFGTMPLFYVKLSLITIALLIAGRIRRVVVRHAPASDASIPRQAQILAAASLMLWIGAITVGRLMAYSH